MTLVLCDTGKSFLLMNFKGDVVQFNKYRKIEGGI